LAFACSGSEDIDFFEPSDDTGGSASGGSAGSNGGSDRGGSSTGGSSTGGTSGDGSGGTGAVSTGGTDETGGTGNETGGTGTGGMATGGTAQGGEAGSDPTGGSGGSGMGGSAGDGAAGTGGRGGSGAAGMGGAGMGGAGMGGAGMGGAGMGGAGMGGAGMGGAGMGGCVPSVPSTERCDGIDNNCTGGVDEGSACPENCTGATRGGHTYLLCSFEKASGATTRARTWTQAQMFCEMRMLDLAYVESAEEDAFILDWIKGAGLEDSVWMGANDRDPTLGLTNEGTWVWGSANNAVQFWKGDEEGSAVMNRYQNWAEGEPNNDGNEDCGAFVASFDYQWDDRACANTHDNFVCESTAPAPN
jgi:hypothetical protein